MEVRRTAALETEISGGAAIGVTAMRLAPASATPEMTFGPTAACMCVPLVTCAPLVVVAQYRLRRTYLKNR